MIHSIPSFVVYVFFVPGTKINQIRVSEISYSNYLSSVRPRVKKEIWRQNLRIFFTSDPPVRPIVSTNDPPPAPAAQNNMITISAATGRVRTAIPYLHQELDNVHLSSALIVVPAMATISCHLRRKYYLQPTLRPRPSSHHDERNSLVISESNTRKDVDPDLINMACQTT